jgi:hypothetical protein
MKSKSKNKNKEAGKQPGPWYVKCIKPAVRGMGGTWVLARNEEHATYYYCNIFHLCTNDSWSAAWFRMPQLAESICAALNKLPLKDQVKPVRAAPRGRRKGCNT